MRTDHSTQLLTVGHGRLSEEQLGDLLVHAGVRRVVDVRRFPGSRANPAVARDALPSWLPGRGIDYRWDERLGGRRQLSPAQESESPDPWWQVAAFRAYAGWTRGPEFAAAMVDLLADVRAGGASVMCSESVWWRCHRRIIADIVALRDDVEVSHLMHTGKLVAHRPSDGARLTENGLVWDVAAQADD